MGLFSSIGNAIGGVVKSAVNLTTSVVKAPFQIANGVLNSVFGDDQSSQQVGYGQQGPSIFGGGPRPMGPPPFGMHGHHHMHGPHGHHHHGPHMPPPPGQGGIHFHFDS